MAGAKQAAKKNNKRLRLSRDVIVDAAIRYADKYGVEQLSMRQLAKELDCGVMSLYNHVSDKEDLIEGMLNSVAAEIELPAKNIPQAEWREHLRRCCISAYKVLLQHHWAPKSWGQGNGPAKNDYHEAILRVLREAGFSEELSCRGFHGLTMHVVGFSMQVLELRPLLDTKKKMQDIGGRVLEELSEDDYPYLREHVHFHLDGKDQRNDFKYMLDLILEGLERDLVEAE